MNVKYENAFEHISKLIDGYSGKFPLIIAFDGRSASGKSSLAERFERELNIPVIHTDDFFRPRNKHGELEISEFDGNFDVFRFKSEIVDQLRNGMNLRYGVFDCKLGKISRYNEIAVSNYCIIEGAYSLNPNLSEYVGCKIFFDIERDAQRRRILNRNGARQLENFEKIWLPAEERYLEHYKIKERCDIIVNA